MRKNIFDRLQIPHTTEEVEKSRKQRIFSSGHIFHAWIQEITKQAGLSIAQELELQDEDLMVRGHIDDLVLVGNRDAEIIEQTDTKVVIDETAHLILYDYKTRNSRNFSYAKQPSYFHKMQTGTYMYMLRKGTCFLDGNNDYDYHFLRETTESLAESRTCNIEKDTLRMVEVQYLWSDELEKEVVGYWTELNKYWKDKQLPPCTCHEQAGGFMATERYNPYFFNGKPCSLEHFQKHPELVKKWKTA